MIENVYNYLYDYGFNSKDLDNILDSNEEMFFANLTGIKKHISFLEGKHLESKDIIKVVNSNPYMLTDREDRYNYLDNIYYKELEIDDESLKQLIINNPKTYSVNPTRLREIINYMEELGYSKKEVREFLLVNYNVIEMDLETFKKSLVKKES